MIYAGLFGDMLVMHALKHNCQTKILLKHSFQTDSLLVVSESNAFFSMLIQVNFKFSSKVNATSLTHFLSLTIIRSNSSINFREIIEAWDLYVTPNFSPFNTKIFLFHIIYVIRTSENIKQQFLFKFVDWRMALT